MIIWGTGINGGKGKTGSRRQAFGEAGARGGSYPAGPCTSPQGRGLLVQGEFGKCRRGGSVSGGTKAAGRDAAIGVRSGSLLLP